MSEHEVDGKSWVLMHQATSSIILNNNKIPMTFQSKLEAENFRDSEIDMPSGMVALRVMDIKNFNSLN